ncbi:MAG: MFS transporter [Spirochaetia bacterium]|nr:MFS transporter [Spirochaetia bacterium]
MRTKTNLTLGLVQGFYWMASCVFVSFLVRLLRGYGYGDYQTGIALTFSSLASLVIQPLVGRLADSVRSVRKLLITCLLIACGSALLLDAFHDYPLVVYLLILVIFGSFRSLVYIIDLWSLAVSKECEDFSYGFTRSFGAVFYAVSAVFYGSAIDRFGTLIIIPCFCTFSLLVVVMALFVKSSEPKAVVDIHEHSLPALQALKILFTNKAYLVLLVSYTFIEMSCIANQNYLTRKFEVMGSGDFFTGLALLTMGMLQLIPLLLNAQITRKFSPPFLLLVCFIGLNLRNAIMVFSTTPLGTVSSYLTEPIGFGLYIGTILYYMNSILPPKVRYLGMTLYAALTAGLGGMAGNYLAGMLSKSYGILTMMKFLAIPALIGLGIYLIFYPGKVKRTIV